MIAVFIIVACIVFKTKIPTCDSDGIYGDIYNSELYATEYALFTAYVSTAVTIGVSALLAFVSSLLLGRLKNQEKPEQTEQTSSQAEVK